MNFTQKVSAINKSLVKHDSDINNVNLLRISLKDECESPCKRLFPLSRNFYARTCVKFTFANKKEVNERSYVSLEVGPRSTSHLISTLYILPLCYLRDLNVRALTCVAKIALVEINLKPR